MNGVNGGSKTVIVSSSSSFTLSSSSNGCNSLSATIPTGASSLASSHSSSSSFHSNSNANFMPLNSGTMLVSGGGDNYQGFESVGISGSGNGGSLRRFSSFDQNINDLNVQSNEFSLNSTLTNKEAQLQYENGRN